MQTEPNIDSNSETLTCFRDYSCLVQNCKSADYGTLNDGAEFLSRIKNMSEDNGQYDDVDDVDPEIDMSSFEINIDPTTFMRYSENFTDGSCNYIEFPLNGDRLDEQSSTSNIIIDKNVIDAGIGKISDSTNSRDTQLPSVITVPGSFLSMENSNNAIDICSISMNNREPATSKNSNIDQIFKLPNSELTFNGTLKHLQKLQPIMDHISIMNARDSFSLPIKENVIIETIDEMDDKSVNSNSRIASIFSTSTRSSNCNTFMENTESEVPAARFEVEENDRPNSSLISCDFSSTIPNCEEVPSSNKTCKDDSFLNDTFASGIRSPSLFSDDEDEFRNNKNCTETEKIDSLSESFEYDRKLIKRLEKTLQGVPPPPSITISQLSSLEILNLYQKNLPKYDCIGIHPVSESTPVENAELSTSSKINNYKQNDDAFVLAPDVPERLLYINSTKELVVNETWPKIISFRYYGIYYNSSIHSEEIDRLLSKYLLRYIGCETASSHVSFMLKKSPAKRSLRSSIGKSPGRRLSHLARRKITFCNAENFKGIFAAKKQILIDKTRCSNIFQNRSQSLRRTPRKSKTPKKKTPLKKTPKSKTPKKKTPSSSQKKKMMRRLFSNDPSNKLQLTKESTKRALFMSPDKTTSDDNVASTSKAIRSKRALFNTPQKSSETPRRVENDKNDCDTNRIITKKRFRLDDSLSDNDSGNRSKLPKSLSFGGDKIMNDAIPISKHASENVLNKKDSLSDLHRKKLSWAVGEALRYHKIGVKHEKFRLLMPSLGRLTRKISQLPYYARVLHTPGTSTSETLLRIARQHAFSVISGKSIDEIFTEEQNKLNNLHSKKITGYVPLNSNDSSSNNSTPLSKNNENLHDNEKQQDRKNSGNDIKNVLQDKTIDLNVNGNPVNNKKLSTPDKKKPFSSFRDNKLQACRQISLDVDNWNR